MVRRLSFIAVPSVLLFACAGSSPPPTVTIPPSLPSSSSASGGSPLPAASGSGSGSSSGFDPASEEMGGPALARRFEKALNDGSTEDARKLSTPQCWAHECRSISEQAKEKFKVKITGSAEMRGIRGAITMDALCEGTRPCDRVYVLVQRNCQAQAQNAWLVHDITEDDPKRAEWLRSAASTCDGAQSADPLASSGSGDSSTPSSNGANPPPANMTQVIAALQPQVRACVGQPRAQGRATFDVKIAPDGSVTDVPSRKSTLPPTVTSCISGVLKTAKFSAPPGGKGTSLVIPYSFQ